MNRTTTYRSRLEAITGPALLVVCLSAIFLAACSQLEKPKPEAFYAETDPPRVQEFRWSNGRMPSTFDPLKASAPPETDIVRAIFEGLTEIDPKTLEAVPGIAVKWESAEEGREWTFELRRDAKWTNGDPVVAEDFVRSWKRVAEEGRDAAHFAHISNIRGFEDHGPEAGGDDSPVSFEKPDAARTPPAGPAAKLYQSSPASRKDERSPAASAAEEAETPEEPEFGAVAVDEHLLKVFLKRPDTQFPKLAAHPVLRPVYGDGKALEGEKLSSGIVTNGAFRVSDIDNDGVTLERSETYFAKDSVRLARIRLVVAMDADSALAEYKAGRVDAVTNTDFEPLALKLLTPFVDFRRATHSALNFYEFNRKKAPFNDRRVREALAIAIDRKRLTEDLTDGAMEPAYGFLPFSRAGDTSKLEEDTGRARELLEKAGFSGGAGFPVVRLVVNRNDLQQKVAREVASMWKENLGIETEIVILEFAEMEAAREAGEYDLIRRGAVLPTSDETANMLAIFSPYTKRTAEGNEGGPEGSEVKMKGPVRYPDPPPPLPDANLGLSEFDGLPPSVTDELTVKIPGEGRPILTEEAAVHEVPAIPLYFPTSYSLVKPYVFGFDINSLDAPLLRAVSIDSNWRPRRSGVAE